MVYSETITRQREDSSLEENPLKVYVTVYARFTPEGDMEPLCLEWEDGRRFSIDRITDRRRAASRKAGGCGIRYTFFLGQKSEVATRQDLSVGKDLADTLQANKDRCVGMAANMIGVKKRIIIVNAGMLNIVMYNPVIIKEDSPYETEEGCLSLDGERKTTRYENIEVEYTDSSWKKHRQKYSGRAAQIIQHEMDHLNGIII